MARAEAPLNGMVMQAAQPDVKVKRRTVEAVVLFPGLVAAMACLDLLGWLLHVPRLTSVLPHYATMKPNTAVCLMLLAAGCWGRGRTAQFKGGQWSGAAADFAEWLSLLLSGGTLMEYPLHIQEGLDGLLVRLPVLTPDVPPGRMAEGTAACLILLALGLLLMDRLPRVSVGLLIAVAGISLSELIGFVFSAGPLFGVPWLSSLAVHTATCLLLLALAGLVARPQLEPIHSLYEQAYRKGRTRWLLLGVTVLPLVVALPLLLLMRAGLSDAGFTLSMLVVLLTGIQTLILWEDSRMLIRAEERRVQAEQVLMQTEKLAVVGRLSASIAHEINNPLESVGTLVYLIQGAESLEEASKYAKMAQEELLRVTQITSQTLKSVREPTESNCEPVEIMDSALRLLHGKLIASGVTVTQKFEVGAGSVNCKDGELRQVFINLISNALEATARGGRLVVRIRRSRRTVFGRAHGREETEGVRIVLADNGTGMSLDVQRRIFEPFFTTKTETGNGLGLWVAQNLVEKHGGSLRVKSCTQPGRTGTVFSIFLPHPGYKAAAAKA